MQGKVAGSNAKLVIGGMFAMAAAFGFGRFVFTPILPHMIADGLTASHAGLLAAANYFGYLAAAVLGAFGAMQTRARAWYILSVAVSGLSLVAVPAADSLVLQSVLRFLSGVGGAVVMIAGATLVFQPLQRAGGLFALAPFCGVGLGIAVSSLIVSLLGAAGAHWQTMWIVTGVVAFAATFPIAVCLPRDTAGSSTTADTSMPASRIEWSRRLVLLTLSYGLFGFGYVITVTFIVVITRETPSLASVEPYIWAIVGLSGASTILVWTAIARRLGDVRTYALACLTEAIGVALSVLDPSPPTIILSAIFVGGTFMAITGLGLQIGRRLAVGGPQKIQAVMTVAFGVGQVVGPLLAGPLRDMTGSFYGASLAAAAALTIGAVLALLP